MNTKHTPGPWHVEKWEIGNKKDDPTTVVVSETDAVAYIQPLWVRDDRVEEHEANARLIAAAPDLLDLAKEALAQLEQMDFSLSANWNGSVRTNTALLLEKAIAKAEGN